MNWKERSDQLELLDAPDNNWDEISRNLKELNTINHWLGGHRITINGIRNLLGKKTTVLICEIGCGGGDNLKVLSNWAEKKGINMQCIGIDINRECIAYAQEQFPAATYFQSDYRKVEFFHKPDIIYSSLFCHHFTDAELVDQLQWMEQNSLTGFFINDLHRNRIAYYSIKWLTTFFSSSRLVKNDAPISVQRGFLRRDWHKVLNASGFKKASIQWQWAFRWLVTVSNSDND